MSDQIDKLADATASKLEAAILTTIDDAKASLDLPTLIAVVDQADDADAITDHEFEQLAAALGIDGDRIDGLDAALNDSAAAGALGTLFLAVAALASQAVGHSLNANDRRAIAARDEALTAFKVALISDGAHAARDVSERMIAAAGSAASRARQIVRSIGLSRTQANKLTDIRRILFDYLQSEPGNTRSGSKTDATIETQVRQMKRRTRGVLSAAQQNMLIKAVRDGITPANAEKLLDRHAKALTKHRAKTAAEFQAHRFSEQAKLTAWRIAQRFGILPTDQRRHWRTAGDERVRHNHAEVPGMNRGGVFLDKPFHTPLGDVFAPPLEINCRCRVVLRHNR